MQNATLEPQKRQWTAEELEDANRRLEGATPEEILAWALKQFPGKVTLACSFGGVGGMALLDMTLKLDRSVSVFYADTVSLSREPPALLDPGAEGYGIEPQAFKSALTPLEQAAQYGEALWSRDPNLCCDLRKVEPTARALEDFDAWITGIRRDQSSTRKEVAIVEWDAKFGLVKVNPLAAWDEAQTRSYLAEHDVPYNPLNDQGYPSLGCTHCTHPVQIGEDPRAGRWAGFDKTECGLHFDVPQVEKKPGFLSILKNLAPGG